MTEIDRTLFVTLSSISNPKRPCMFRANSGDLLRLTVMAGQDKPYYATNTRTATVWKFRSIDELRAYLKEPG